MGSQTQFGKNIRKARTAAGMTQKQVAEKAGLHVNYIARIERGEENPSYEAIEKIIKALKVKSAEVLPF
ncbi:helix-turn-helix transcriptional regulator [Candidatus Nomurabacteria bacterium]|nr:helix-turn-helix transcriptional regulator [Candidatus Nomurabacteria bacterium]